MTFERPPRRIARAISTLLLSAPLILSACDDSAGSDSESLRLQSVTRIFAQPDANRFVVKFAPGKGPAARLAAASAGGQHKLDIKGADAFAAVFRNARAAQGLANNPNIEWVEPDAPRFTMGSLPEEVVPYGITMVEADQVANAGGRTVCIIDSGYSSTHEDLQTGNVTASPDPGTGDPFYDDNGHGTHVAGTISALGSNGHGVRGVIDDGALRLHIVKVFTAAGWAYSSTLANAAQACADAGANIISMSLGGDRKNRTEQVKFDQLDSAGILSIAAAGNDGNTRHNYPASYSSVMSIAAVDESGTVASFSQQTSQVELAAPGVAVLSTVPYNATAQATVGGVTYAGSQMENAAEGTVTGDLVNGGLCDSVGNWTGQVVLCERGSISFFDKVSNAEAGGAAATIVYNNEPGMLHGTLGDGNTSNNPAIGVSQADGQALAASAIGQPTTVEATYVFPATDGYEYYDGTSMATPHVSAVAALIWSHYPNATNDDIRNALRATAEDRGAAGRDDAYGYGIVKAKAALDYLGGSTGGGGPPANQPPSASFTDSCTSLDCAFDASGSSDTDGSITDYAWDFGDGATASGVTASHSYASSGSYVVTLTVTDDQGATASTSRTVVVSDGSVNLVISNVSSAKTGGPSFEISWTTNLPATSKVTFTCCGEFTDGNLVTNHTMGFRGSKGATYEYFVSSTDANGVEVTAGPFTHQN